MSDYSQLPADIIQYCCKYVDVVSQRTIGCVCKSYYNALIDLECYLPHHCHSLSDYACILGYLSIVEELDDMISDTTATYTALNGHLLTFIWLTENVTWNKEECLIAAVYNGHCEIVQYILTTFPITTLTFNCKELNSKRLPVEVIDECKSIGRESSYLIGSSTVHKLTYLAARRNHWNIVTTFMSLVNVNVDDTDRRLMLINAARGNHLSVLLSDNASKEQFDHTCVIDTFLFSLRSLLQDGVVVDEIVIDDPFAIGIDYNQRQVAFIRAKRAKHRPQMTLNRVTINDCLSAAVKCGHIQLASVLFERSQCCSLELLKGAIGSGNVDMIELCLSHVTITANVEWLGSLTYAIQSKSVEMFEYIHTHYPLIQLDHSISWRDLMYKSKISLPILQYIHRVADILPHRYDVIANGNLEVLQWWSAKNTVRVVENHRLIVLTGDVAMLDWFENTWLPSNSCNLSKDLRESHYDNISSTSSRYRKMRKWLATNRDYPILCPQALLTRNVMVTVTSLPLLVMGIISICRMYEVLSGRNGWECWHVCHSLLNGMVAWQSKVDRHSASLLSIGHCLLLAIECRWSGQLLLWLLVWIVDRIIRHH